jgi:chromosome segregation ATPase
MSEDALRSKINELEKELEKKDLEIHEFLDKIEDLEDQIMRQDDLISDVTSGKKSKKLQAMDSKYALDLEEKDKQIRDLKDKLGFLRKENMELQRQIDNLTDKKPSSTVIRIEDLKPQTPLNTLVKELQDKVNKQRSEINELERKIKDKDKYFKKKEEQIAGLETEVSELNQKLNDSVIRHESKESNSIQNKLIDDLQSELNRSKKKIKDLNKKVEKYKKKDKKQSKGKDIPAFSENSEFSSQQPHSEIIQDLQNKLNKSKNQIKTLQKELEKYKNGKTSEKKLSKNELEGQLKMQREMAIFLQKQLKMKDSEIETIKNEAVQIKGKYKQLENQLKTKEQKVSELHNKLENSNFQPKKLSQINSEAKHNLNLRLKELENLVEELKKQNSEQRLEISQLREQLRKR